MGDVGAAAAGVAEQVRQSVVEVRPRRGGAGAGTIWRRDGTIVTNYHVAGRDRARVRLADGRELNATVTAFDARNDLAVLSVPAVDLPAAEIGDARTLRPGELVLAVGHPYGVRNAVTVGVVNSALPGGPGGPGRPGGPGGRDARGGPRRPEALHRRAEGVAGTAEAPEGARPDPEAPPETRGRRERLEGAGTRERNRLWRWGQGRELVMADVLLGPGNSGGPLADARGRVVGINAMVADGLALAVPSHLVERLLTRQGDPPRLGVAVQDVLVPPPLAARAGVEPGAAPMLIEILAGSPAARSGLLVGDVLVAVDGIALDGSGGLLNALEAHGAEGGGGAVALTLIRGGEAWEVAVPLDGAGAPEEARAA
jgi:S1-C subfamily serine protease